MSLAPWKKLAVAALMLSIISSLAYAPPSLGQEAKRKAAAKEPAKAKGRLPAYYREIVTDEQREKIYALQAKYDSQIEELTQQLEALRSQRDADVEAVLTADQKAKLAEVRTAADAKRKKKSDPADAKKSVESEKKAAVGK